MVMDSLGLCRRISCLPYVTEYEEYEERVQSSTALAAIDALLYFPPQRGRLRAVKVIVIIPAAGLGTRMAAGKSPARKMNDMQPSSLLSKQFAELAGTPIIIHTLRRFAECKQIDRIFVALRQQEMKTFQVAVDKETFARQVQLVEGGENRQQSVANALAVVKAEAKDVILVHDAVRPFITTDLISRVIAAAVKNGAAIAGMPAVDTVKQVERVADGAIVTSTIPRERVVMAQTPQGFRYEVLKKAFDEAQADAFTGTDEASLVERSGGEVAVVMGSPMNIKITTPGDMELAEFYVKAKG
jgi:2-C-methyl-D-erythritol 4-phosphate cytidylyltransferase